MLEYMISPLNRYFNRVFLMWVLAVTSIVMAVISLFEVTEQARKAMGNQSVQFGQILETLLLKMPAHFQMLLPFIVLIAGMITLARLNYAQEITAAKSCGISVWQLICGLSATVFMLGMFNLAVINPLSAQFNKRVSKLENNLYNEAETFLSLSETGLWIREAVQDEERIVHIPHISPKLKECQQVTFHIYKNSVYHERIDAQTARLDLKFWHLTNTTRWGNQEFGRAHQELVLPSILSFEKLMNSNMLPESISFWKLPKYISILEKSGLSSLAYRVYWHGLLAKMGMMVTMIILAAAFSLRPVRQGYTVTLIASGVACGFLLHFLNDIIIALGMADKLPPFLAAWSPTLVMSFLAVTLLLHTEEGG